MLTEYTTPGPALTVRNDETIYALLTDRIARSGETPRSPRTRRPTARGASSPPGSSMSGCARSPKV